MKVNNGVWVVKIAHDYAWATIYGKYANVEEARHSGYTEADYDGFKVRYLHEGEELPNVEDLYGL